MRLHELAKELGLATNNLINYLRDAGFDIKGPLNVLGDEEINYAKTRLAPKKEPESAPKQSVKPIPTGGTKKKVFIRKTATVDPRTAKMRPTPTAAASPQARPSQIPPKRMGAPPGKAGVMPVLPKKPVKPVKPAEQLPLIEVDEIEVAKPDVEVAPKVEAPPAGQPTPSVSGQGLEAAPTAVREPREKITPITEKQGPRPERPGGPRPERPGGPRPDRQGPRPERPGGPRPERPGGQRPDRQGPRPERHGGPRPDRPGGPRPERPGGPRPDRPVGPRQEHPGGPRPERPGGQRPDRQGPRPERPGGPRPDNRQGPRPERPGGPRPGGGQQRPRQDSDRPRTDQDRRRPDDRGYAPKPQGFQRDDQRRGERRFDKQRPPSDRPKFSKEEAIRVASEKRRGGPTTQRPRSQMGDRGGVSGIDALGLQKAPSVPGEFKRRRRKGGKDSGRERAKESPKDIILEGQAFDQGILQLKGSFKPSVESGAIAKGKRRKKILPVDKKRPRTALKPGKRDESEYGGRSLLVKKHRRKKSKDFVPELADIKSEIHKKIRVTDHMTIKDLSAVTGVRSPAIMKFLLDQLNLVVNINQVIDKDIATLILENLGFEYEVTVKQVEDVLKKTEDTEEQRKRRPPVVTVLGHVDHGKTRLLDTIRRTNVAASEAGGITQAIGAYQVKVKERSITFIDTPGHEAFTAMRARGAKVTDVAILVVACDDGVQPQTLEAIDHARSAGTEIIVALNKIDLPTADVERTKGQLAEAGLIPEEWGGKTVMVPISAKFGQGIDELLELVLLQADLLDLKANPDAPAEGTIIEAKIDRGKGALATVLVQRGTLHVGDYVVAGCSYGRLRAMNNEFGQEVLAAGPSVPVELFGLSDVPQAGDIMNQVENEKIAKEIYDKRCLDRRQERIHAVTKISLEDLYKKIKEGEAKELNLIIKADMQGSIEAIIHALKQLDSPEVQIKFISASVGNVKESDIMLALASKAIIIGFNVVVSAEMKKLATMEGIDIRAYNIIYKAVEDIEKAMKGLLEPEFEEKITGTAEVRAIFKKAKGTIIAGLIVSTGSLRRGGDIRIMRNGEKIWSGKLNSLKRFTDDAREVDAGLECGISLDNITDLLEGDIMEEYEMVEKPRA